MQNAAVGQETSLSRIRVSTGVGGVHEVPSYVVALPLSSIATQKVSVAQET